MTIHKLDLSENSIGPAGGKALFEMLRENVYITHIVCSLLENIFLLTINIIIQIIVCSGSLKQPARAREYGSALRGFAV